jgi:hypothetical protein
MEVEWLILADAVQVVGNKLYLLGGGWDQIAVNSPFPINQRLGIAVAVKVPWNETNQKHTFEVEIVSEDHSTEQPKSLMKMGGQFEIGRPPGIRQGQDQRIQMALDMTLGLDAPGIKTVIAKIEGQEMRRLDFTVSQGPMAPKIKPEGQ